jgi:hypothetical protein
MSLQDFGFQNLQTKLDDLSRLQVKFVACEGADGPAGPDICHLPQAAKLV